MSETDRDGDVPPVAREESHTVFAAETGAESDIFLALWSLKGLDCPQ